MLSALAAAGVALAMITAPQAAPSDNPPTDRITIDVVTVNGSGCPAGTTAVAVSSDNTAFTVTYSDYTAQVGDGAAPTDMRKNCQLALRLHIPQGFTYAIAQADYRGFAHLASGAEGLQQASYYIQGTSPTHYVKNPVGGPYSDNWQFTDKTDMAELVYAPCGEERNLNVNTELRVYKGDSGNASSFMSMDSTDAGVSTKYHFHWKKCP
ncbi:uncharacterized protein DUF4360 [Herbihabitans rhizosphaerae]|uniref:Uncharacterized protein DUF4360 n=1 Tax=Herbihabitans rhizosphaerae TaxID=1872711 RepID=A0A4Q7L7R5_9PSEU|nr:DUF4360 domain-containing protein [Herbihabitans rhizosphaerae]RZS44681.1 uncharacterized protein DUF4360 [Herbihabitans rhizosphaerae]